MNLRIRGGRILDPAAGMDRRADLFIAAGRIAAIGRAPSGFQPKKEIDASGCLVLPGLVDLCARFREPGFEHKATIASESAAAAAGGVTTVCCPPDTDPVIDTPAVAELIHQRANAVGRTRVCTLGALTRGLNGEQLAEMRGLREAGCRGVSNGQRPLANNEVLRRALEYAASFGLTVFLSPEDYHLCNEGVVHEGPVGTRLGLPPIPATAETVALSAALLLVEQTGARTHFGRLSTARSVDLIARAKGAGLPVSADVGICHLHLTDEDVDGFNAQCHLRPPLRGAADRDALRAGLAAGSIDAVCSDHRPHDDDAKAAPFSESEPGASTIELLLPLLLDVVSDAKIDLMQALGWVTSAPAAVLGIDAGTLGRDRPADVVIVDPKARRTVDPAALVSAGKNTPFGGRTLAGAVRCTLLGGRIVAGS